MNVNQDITVSFEKGDDGSRTMVFQAVGGQPVQSIGYDKANYSDEDLSAFTGQFYSPELDASYGVESNDGHLNLIVNQKPISPLNPLMHDTFSNNRFGLFQFEKDSNGTITGFTLAAGRVKNLKFSRVED